MDIIKKLMAEKEKIMGEIQFMAKSGDSQGVLSGGRRLEEIEDFLHRTKQLKSEVETFLRGNDLTELLVAVSDSSANKAGHLEIKNPRQKGAEERNAFVKRVAATGLALRKQKGTIFLTPSGESVGIPFATEQRPNRWFLGLKEGAFDSAVLLCEDKGRLRELWVSPSTMSKYSRLMSTSNGDIKFNVVRSGPRLTLQVPREGQVTLEELRGEYKALIDE